MKKLFLFVSLVLFACPQVWADYKPIFADKSSQYKIEMEQIIDTEYEKSIDNIDNLVKKAKDLRDKMMQNGYNFNDYANIILISEVSIPAAELDLYEKLMKKTQEKYLGIKYEPIATGNTNPINEFLYPYFKDNKINTKKLTKIIVYENKQIEIVEKYIKQVEKIRTKFD